MRRFSLTAKGYNAVKTVKEAIFLKERAESAYIVLKKLWTLLQKHRKPLSVFWGCFLFGMLPVAQGYPFGFALYIAAEGYDGVGFAGLFAAALFGGMPPMGIAVAMLLYFYKKLTSGRKVMAYAKPMAALCAMLFLWTVSGDGVYGLAHSSPMLLICPLFTLLYGFALDKSAKSAARHGGYAAFLFTVALLFGEICPFELITRSVALFWALSAAASGGMLYGGLYGFACGLGFDTGTAAVCCVVGLCAGLFYEVGGHMGELCGAVAGLCTGFYFFGAADTLWLFCSYLVALAAHGYLKNRLPLFPKEPVAVEGVGAGIGRAPFAEAFFAISRSVKGSGGEETEATRTADQYAGISSLLAREAQAKETEALTDLTLSSRAGLMLCGAGVRAESVRVTGGRKKRLVAEGVEVDRLAVSSAELVRLMSAALDCPMKEPVLTPVGGKARLTMEAAPRFSIECSRIGCPKRGEEVCGDTVSFFANEGGYFYALISDGMGSGRSAAESSRLAGLFLEKLLMAGADRKAALRLLNGFLASREEEVFATVDLFEADLYTGKGVMIKAGAAPSFILRDGEWRKLQSATAPAGIIRDINAEQMSFDLKDGDTVVMLSDGLAGDGDGAETADFLALQHPCPTPSVLATKLLSAGTKRTGASDDMSVCVVKISAA